MRTIPTLVLALGCAAAASGCAVGVGYSVPISGGRGEPVEEAPPPEASEEVAGTIVPGRSTQGDVAALLGPPASAHRDEAGHVVWTYWSTETAGGSYAHQALRVVFDPNGVVLRVDSHRAAP